jgi:RNA polymerase sigma factor (sigma-70 family)
MREILEHLLQSVDVPNSERAQLHWDEYRSGAASPDPAVKAAADAAFATLLAWYGGGLYRHIWGFIRTDAAEDVFQDVLRKLHEKRQSSRLADFHANVLPWLRTVAIRECVDAHRRAARRRSREEKAARPENEPRSENRNELQEVLAVALARLTPAEQQAIALHYFEGLDKQATAAILGVHRDTVADRLHRALARLKKLVPTPVGILVGGSLTGPAALTARPPSLNSVRLSELIIGAFAKSSSVGWSKGRIAFAMLMGLGMSGTSVAAWLIRDIPQSQLVPTVTCAPLVAYKPAAQVDSDPESQVSFEPAIKGLDDEPTWLIPLAPCAGPVELLPKAMTEANLDPPFWPSLPKKAKVID